MQQASLLLIEKQELLKSPLETLWIDATYDDISYVREHNVLFIKYFNCLYKFILVYSFPDKVSLKGLTFEVLVQTQIFLYYFPLLAETGLGQQLLVEGCKRKGPGIPVQDRTGPDGSRTLGLSDIMTNGT